MVRMLSSDPISIRELFSARNVKPSNSVQAFDPLCEVQSDKASVEITSPFDGVIKELLVKEGDVAKVGETLCMIEIDEEDTSDTDNLTHAESATGHPSQPSSSTPLNNSFLWHRR